MKKFGILMLMLGLTSYAVGCGEKETTPPADTPAATETTPEATDTPAAEGETEAPAAEESTEG